MSQLRVPGLGPIVGHTTETTARVWIRGGGPGEEGADVDPHRRTLGVIALTEEDGRRIRAPSVHYFRLRREYDRTGTFTLGEETGIKGTRASAALRPGTRYVARVGTLSVDDPNPDDDSISSDILAERLPSASVWRAELDRLDPERSTASFTTFPAAPAGDAGPLSFILGSCRYPGLLWKAKHSDAIFAPMLEEAAGRGHGGGPVRFALMVGDQIYADMLNRHVPVGLADTFGEFQERYHTAFGSPNMRRLLRNLPTYMILDDHEIEDNWTQDRIRNDDKRCVFNLAINAYMSYQWVHGPTRYGRRLFYDFECAGYPFFVLDTRTQRFMEDVRSDLADNHLLGRPSLAEEEPSQLDLLLRWLERQQYERGDRPKFVVTSSVFAPNPMSAREGREGDPEQRVRWKEASDSWPAFPTTRRAILGRIVERSIQNVVFLSGDIHCANVAALRFSGSPQAERLRAYSITSSAFYWPFAFADGEPSSFVHDSTAEGQEDSFDIDGRHKLDYRAWNFTQEDNYCRVDVEPGAGRIVVRAYGTDGEPIERGGWFGLGGEPIVSTLELAGG